MPAQVQCCRDSLGSLNSVRRVRGFTARRMALLSAYLTAAKFSLVQETSTLRVRLRRPAGQRQMQQARQGIGQLTATGERSNTLPCTNAQRQPSTVTVTLTSICLAAKETDRKERKGHSQGSKAVVVAVSRRTWDVANNNFPDQDCRSGNPHGVLFNGVSTASSTNTMHEQSPDPHSSSTNAHVRLQSGRSRTCQACQTVHQRRDPVIPVALLR